MNSSGMDSGSGDPIAWGIFGLEVLVDLLNIPISLLNFHFIYSTMVIHRNLKFILLCQSANFLLRSLIKLFFTLPGRLISGNIFWFERAIPQLQFVFFSSITFRMLLGHVIVVERLLATIYARHYEQYKNNTFSAVWFGIVIVIVLFNSISQFSALSVDVNDITTILTVTTTFGVTLLSFLEIGFAAFLWHFNRRKFANYKRPVSLAERYQLLENVRTALQLVPALALYFLLLIVSNFVQINFQFKVIPSVYGQNFALIASNLVTSLLQMLIEICVLVFHPVLSRRCRFFFSKFLGCRQNRVEPSSGEEIELKGKMMSMERHFQILEQYWRH